LFEIFLFWRSNCFFYRYNYPHGGATAGSSAVILTFSRLQTSVVGGFHWLETRGWIWLTWHIRSWRV